MRQNEIHDLIDEVLSPNFLQHKLGLEKVHLDLDKAVVVGHSFGGATALAAGVNDKRIKAICTHDPWLYPIHKDIFGGTLGPKV